MTPRKIYFQPKRGRTKIRSIREVHNRTIFERELEYRHRLRELQQAARNEDVYGQAPRAQEQAPRAQEQAPRATDPATASAAPREGDAARCPACAQAQAQAKDPTALCQRHLSQAMGF